MDAGVRPADVLVEVKDTVAGSKVTVDTAAEAEDIVIIAKASSSRRARESLRVPWTTRIATVTRDSGKAGARCRADTSRLTWNR